MTSKNSPVYDYKSARVLIGRPVYRGTEPLTIKSIQRLKRKSIEAGVGIFEREEFSSLIPRLRNSIADVAIKMEATHLLFVDSDMVFEDDALLRLLALDRDVVGGLAVSRAAPYVPCVKKKDKDGVWMIYQGLEDGRFRSDCDGVGTGFLLIKMGVFKALEKPYFCMPPLGDEFMGEDMYFCDKAKKAGYDICVDPSLIIGHIGDHTYVMQDYLDYKDARDGPDKGE